MQPAPDNESGTESSDWDLLFPRNRPGQATPSPHLTSPHLTTPLGGKTSSVYSFVFSPCLEIRTMDKVQKASVSEVITLETGHADIWHLYELLLFNENDLKFWFHKGIPSTDEALVRSTGKVFEKC
jgi:hypothetical protein